MLASWINMKIVDVDGWQPWQTRLAGVSLAWWLALVPTILAWACERSSIALTSEARGWLGTPYLLLLLGVLQALFTAGASESPRARCVAWWFLLGVLLGPLALAVTVARM